MNIQHQEFYSWSKLPTVKSRTLSKYAGQVIKIYVKKKIYN